MGQDKLNVEQWPTTSILLSMLSEQGNMRFAVLSLMGMVIDLLVFQVLAVVGTNIEASQVTSFFAGAIFNFVLNARTSVSQPKPSGRRLQYIVYSQFLIACLLALSLRTAVFMLLMRNWHLQPQIAILIAILVATPVSIIGASLSVLSQCEMSRVPAVYWRRVSVATVIYVLVLKLPFMGLVNVIPEEAYYWNYAQHLDLSYLDHPPMVAWLIWLSTWVLDKSEFSVRFPAYICWIVTAVFMFRLSVNLCGRSAAFRSVLLLAVLPIYFGVGFFITPDAPFFAAWAGCLYFLERTLIAQKPGAWWGVGLCIGLGMLAKYTIALLGLGTLMFLLLDRQSRGWLLRPQPYLAALVAAILFSPVLVWNVRNDWVSFIFQGPSRWFGTPDFSLHWLLLSVLLVLTPVGLLSIVKIFLYDGLAATISFHHTGTQRNQRLWLLNFTLVPLSVFVIHSLYDDSKLHWTGPVWLAAIPLLAGDMVPHIGEITGSLTRFIRRVWMPTIIVLLLIYGGFFCYISLGFPWAPMSTRPAFGEWRLLAEKVEEIEASLADETESEPVTVGMDKNRISSELSFYDFADRDGSWNTGGPHFFGGRSLMWSFWLPRSAAVGRNFLMIDFGRERLVNESLSQYFDEMSAVVTEPLEKDGRIIAYFYWRVGYGYRDGAPYIHEVIKNF